MLNVAIFISGRCFGYKDVFLPLLNILKTKYNIYLFLSINSDTDEDVIQTLQPVKYEFKRFFFEDDWIDNRIKNNCKFVGPYNQLSCFYNDYNNFKMIESYEEENNIKFDVISKLRTDMVFYNPYEIIFVKDEEEEICLHNVELECTIRWHGISSPLLSDAFCFGNKKSMKIYCNTYNWIKQKDIECNGNYNRTFEPYLNENIFGCLFNNPINHMPIYSFNEYEEMMKNNVNCVKFKRYNWRYTLLKNRSIDNNKNQPTGSYKFKNKLLVWNNQSGLIIEENKNPL
jgi:hypothetical protein